MYNDIIYFIVSTNSTREMVSFYDVRREADARQITFRIISASSSMLFYFSEFKLLQTRLIFAGEKGDLLLIQDK